MYMVHNFAHTVQNCVHTPCKIPLVAKEPAGTVPAVVHTVQNFVHTVKSCTHILYTLCKTLLQKRLQGQFPKDVAAAANDLMMTITQ